MTNKTKAVASFQPGGKALSNGLEKPEISKALRAYIEQNGLRPKFDATEPAYRRDQIRQARDSGTVAQIVMGYWLSDIRASEGVDAFKDAVADLRIGKSSAYNAISSFELFSRFDDLDVVAALGALEPSKALVFKAWSDEELTQLAKGKRVHDLTLDEAIEAPREHLEKVERNHRLRDIEVERLKKALADSNASLEIQAHKAQSLQAKLENRAQTDPLPPFVAVCRQEGAALSEQISIAVDDLVALAKANILDVGRSQDKKLAMHRQMAASSVYHALKAVWVRAGVLLGDLQGEFHGGLDTDESIVANKLSAAEVKTFLARREAFLQLHQHAKTVREIQRDQATPRRGRPRKMPAAPKGGKS